MARAPLSRYSKIFNMQKYCWIRRVRSGELGPGSDSPDLDPTRENNQDPDKTLKKKWILIRLQPLISSYLLTLTYFIYSFRNITIDFIKIIDTGLQTGSGSTSYTFETRNWIRIYPLHKCTDPRLCAKHLGLQSCSLLNLILKRQISEFELIHLIFPNLIKQIIINECEPTNFD